MSDLDALEDFFENGAIPLHLVGSDGTILRANRAELALLGYSASEYVGHNITDFHADRPVIEDILRRLAQGEVLRNYEARLCAKDGSIKHVLIDSSGHFAAGEFINTRCFTRDNSAVKALEAEREALSASERAARQEAERLNRLKDEFLATLSHELRTPLNAVLGWARLLEMQQFPPDEVHRAVQVIARNAELQAHMIDELLDMSRIVTGKLRLDVRPINLVDVIEEAIEAFTPAAEAKGVRLQRILDPGAAAVLGDANRLQQVMSNLMSNAVKFTKKGGRVQISLRRVDSHVEISVADTGSGIAPDLLPHVFDRFRQAPRSEAGPAGGLGIGLAIVRQLVELHGGTVEAASPGVDQGAVFTIRLPLMARVLSASLDRTLAAAGSPTPEGQRLQDLRIVAVDDDPDALDLFAHVLRAYGAEVRTAASSADGMALIESWLPDVLVSDINMPGENGYALIRRVREWERARGHERAIRAVAVTAHGRLEDRIRALESGFQMHVAKPLEPTELVTVIATVAGRNLAGGV